MLLSHLPSSDLLSLISHGSDSDHTHAHTHTHTLGSTAISKVRLLTEGTTRVTKRGEQKTREWEISGGY